MNKLLNELSNELKHLDSVNLRRYLRVIDSVKGPIVRIGEKELVGWCSNDYLGLSSHTDIINAASEAALKWGIGGRASRLLSGNTSLHIRLERMLADWFHAEAAIVYPSGYLTNIGTLGALLSSEDAVVVDRLSHASLIDAARSSRAKFRVFHHNDPSHAAESLSRMGSARRRIIITEGLFSMEGDQPPLPQLVDVAKRYDAIVYLDDAHGAFIIGNNGRGTPEALGVPHDRLIYMGTLGKAIGCQGGFVIGQRSLIEYLQNRARTFIYTTSLAVPVAAAAAMALKLLSDEPSRRALLAKRVGYLHERLTQIGLSGGFSHIVPVVVGDAASAIKVSKQLWDSNHWVAAIRPPTVPNGTARLRISVTSMHTTAHIDQLVEALKVAFSQARLNPLR